MQREAKVSVRLRRVLRHWGLVFLVAVGFLLMALLVRERERVVPTQGLGHPTAEVAA